MYLINVYIFTQVSKIKFYCSLHTVNYWALIMHKQGGMISDIVLYSFRRKCNKLVNEAYRSYSWTFGWWPCWHATEVCKYSQHLQLMGEQPNRTCTHTSQKCVSIACMESLPHLLLWYCTDSKLQPSLLCEWMEGVSICGSQCYV